MRGSQLAYDIGFTRRSVIGAEELGKGLGQDVVGELHVVTGGRLELQAALPIERAQADPVLLVHLAGAQGGGLAAVDVLEPAGLLGDDGGVVVEDVEHEVLEGGDVAGVGLVLEGALVVDVGEEVGVREVAVEVGGVAEVLGGHEARLHEGGPGVAVEQGHGAAAEPVAGLAGAVVDDAVVLAAEGDEAADGGRVAALDVGAQELAALAEADGVDGGGGGEDGVGGEVGADLGDLLRDVAVEGGAAVAARAGVEPHEVHEGARVHGLDELAHLLDALGRVRVAQAVPDDDGERRAVIVFGGVLLLLLLRCGFGGRGEELRDRRQQREASKRMHFGASGYVK